MKKLYTFIALVAVCFAALAGSASANGIFAKVLTETGTPCGSSCTYFVHDNTNNTTAAPVTVGNTVITHPSGAAYWYSEGGLIDYPAFPYNVWQSAVVAGHNYTAYARKLCPNGISYKFTETKGFHLTAATDIWNLGNLTLQASGCQTAISFQRHLALRRAVKARGNLAAQRNNLLRIRR